MMVLCNKMSINAFILLASNYLLDLACDSIDIFESDATIAHNDFQQPVRVLLRPSMTYIRELA